MTFRLTFNKPTATSTHPSSDFRNHHHRTAAFESNCITGLKFIRHCIFPCRANIQLVIAGWLVVQPYRSHAPDCHIASHRRQPARTQLMVLGIAALLISLAAPAWAQFGGGTVTVFDPSMFARQLSQLEQETAAVTNLAQQLQYVVKSTTGGGAGLWASNESFLDSLGQII